MRKCLRAKKCANVFVQKMRKCLRAKNAQMSSCEKCANVFMQKMRKCLHAKNAQMSSCKKCGNVFMQKMRKCLHAKYSLFLSDFKRTFNFLERFSKNNQLNATKIRLFFEPSPSMWTEGRTDRQIRRR